MFKRRQIRVGTKVDSPWGETKITGIELCEEPGLKEGIRVKQMFIDLKDRCVFDLDNGHWAYGYQIDPVDMRQING